jgi:glutamate dehydrogenase (NADP+)
MLQDMLKRRGEDIEGKTCIVSGAGNVATYATQKLIQLGGKVVTLSDSSGFIYDRHGIDADKLAWVIDLKTSRRQGLDAYAKEFGAEFHAGERPWKVPGELALPCATQNEVSRDDVRRMIDNGCQAVSEGANMPVEQEGIQDFVAARVLFAPSKAANAGGVAISGLEMSQNSVRITWDAEELEVRLRNIMRDIHDRCVEHGSEPGSDYVDYVKGANIAGFIKVANAMIAYGVV